MLLYLIQVTNQVCELLACIKALEKIGKNTDSMYIVNTINE
jgi:ribonuclease HI